MKDRKGLCNDLVKTDKDQPLGARLWVGSQTAGPGDQLCYSCL